MAFFHTALSAADISDIYNSGAPADLSSYSPVGWWRMGDGTEAESGTTIYDMSDNGVHANNGTLVNGVGTDPPAYSTDVPS
jgi:hypothetical protein